MRPHRGSVVLAFGILSLVVCPFFGIAAWTMANADLKEMADGVMDPSGKDLTNAGRICGMVGTALLGLQLLIVLFALVVMVISSGT